MDRVTTLSDRLTEQLQSKASLDDLLMTVQMLQAELLHLKLASKSTSSSSIAFEILNPELNLVNQEVKVSIHEDAAPEDTKASKVEEEKVVFTLDIDERIVEEELEQIKKNAEAKNNSSFKNKPVIQFDPLDEIPTLMHQRTELVQKTTIVADGQKSDSLNESLRQGAGELSETFSTTPIKELKKAIGVNDRFVFINELFQGDEVMYERSLKTIDSFKIYPEAEFWIRRELKLKLGWNEKSESVKYFNHLVKRRFDFI
jgi:hypothetical protein